eukprot:30152_1
MNKNQMTITRVHESQECTQAVNHVDRAIGNVSIPSNGNIIATWTLKVNTINQVPIDYRQYYTYTHNVEIGVVCLKESSKDELAYFPAYLFTNEGGMIMHSIDAYRVEFVSNIASVRFSANDIIEFILNTKKGTIGVKLNESKEITIFKNNIIRDEKLKYYIGVSLRG